MSKSTRDIDKLVAELTLEEKARLTAGEDLWSTVPIDRLGIPKVRMSDGPNGARGSALLGAGPASAACTPCGSALGATWNPALVERVGAMVGEEARTKACRVLLGPTVNLHRSPLGGRNFECYAEDPLLAGRIAAAFVRGVQSRGVVTTVKHFAGNDAEFERNTINSVIDDRTLREIYLVPFELAVRDGGALGIMTAYNRLNGPFCAEHAGLLAILRGEWGFEGFVLTDWYALGSTVGSAEAGLDLEMPGPGRFFGPALARVVEAGAVDPARLDAKVRRLLSVFDRVGAFDDPPDTGERAIDRPEHRALVRAAAAEAMVLLKNGGVLPLDPAGLRTLAVIGPNADRAQIMGGGSASLRPHYRITPLQALRAHLGDRVPIRHERGCDIDRTTPRLGGTQLTTPDGTPGLVLEFFADPDLAGPVVYRRVSPDCRLLFVGEPAPEVPAETFSFRATGRFTPTDTGPHTFTLVQAGRARVLVDGEIVLDGTTDPPPPGQKLCGFGSEEIAASVELVARRPCELVIEYSSRDTAMLRGVEIGCRLPSSDDLLDRAVAAAATADAVILLVGTNDDWESEGHDREAMDLPGDQDALVTRVVAANPNTVVVVNSGSPVTMGWAGETPAILQIWFGGQEMANALVDVLVGASEPAGRLPTTFPMRLEHNPSYGNFPGENGQIRYGEGVLVGYRWYEARRLPVRFPFGHGLSYTTFTIGAPHPSFGELPSGATLTVDVPITNTGGRRGAEVVQCYVAPLSSRVVRAPKELKAFAKVWLDPGETATVRLELDDRAFAYWQPGDPDWAAIQARLAGSVPVPAGRGGERRTEPGWYVDAGRYELHIGRSSHDVAHTVPITVEADRYAAGT
ncbi:MAG: beta-glucosidase H [Gammaproteobacteria bacterium]